MLDDHSRLARAVHQPALVRLHRALSRLRSVLTVMNTGAHPDDEINGMLAALRFSHGMRIVVACSTRGEGGQNALGPERGAALGVLRTAEMEEAARRIDADVAWLGHGPDDPVHDFGFSKNGDDTLRRWGEERIVERLVRAYRQYRPDIVIPTFLDVPGQHGHHRAMTRAAETAWTLAADPFAFPEHAREGLRPWQVSKLYLPAWSGAGYAYDDEVPPPPATLSVAMAGGDEVTGLAFRQLGEWSRAAHASQGMGVWRDKRIDQWSLHLKLLAGGQAGIENDIRDRLPASVAALAAEPGLEKADAAALREAQEHIYAAIGAFPDRVRISAALVRAAQLIEEVRKGLGQEILDRMGHRLDRKLREIDAAIFEANASTFRAAFSGACHPGAQASLDVHVTAPGLSDVTVTPRLPAGIGAVETVKEPGHVRFALTIPASASHSGNYPEFFDSMGNNGEAGIRVSGRVGGREVCVDLDPEEPLKIAPPHSLTLDPAVALVRSGEKPAGLRVQVAGGDPAEWQVPEGWNVRKDGADWIVEPPQRMDAGVATLVPLLDGRPASRVEVIAYPHIRPATFIAPAELKVLSLDVFLPSRARIGYIGAGSDNVGIHMRRLGLDVTDLGEADLKAGALSEFTTLVVGIFAFGLRRDLQAATERLHRFVEEGGHLVTLYHRPTDGWDPDRTPPRRLVIGSPSLRWRVTDPSAPVTVLQPDSPLLTYPNRIGEADWQGWDKERGLYFASDYDAAYDELLALNDPGEKPLKGSLVSARIGRGRHTHLALVLHHQLDKLVPGAFRLLANLVQPA
ncbi:LmbE family N-acetylglucosaminyl deacetylase [Microvirga flocculans]|uniref:LmbE family N-acetylglucosaminyl deacetylase n=1 Tax=Microvirga flocculans TaxID=217168 RepID=A0A7W6N7R5_9HYPH|nr:PIG-L family deacetylase [Microvirga flocculans]MBB4040378.1 LmbE family N-acetylglucosaminyl deacetylase [Microvirga flocculans]